MRRGAACTRRQCSCSKTSLVLSTSLMHARRTSSSAAVLKIGPRSFLKKFFFGKLVLKKMRELSSPPPNRLPPPPSSFCVDFRRLSASVSIHTRTHTHRVCDYFSKHFYFCVCMFADCVRHAPCASSMYMHHTHTHTHRRTTE
jgi:hypothetical protein